MPIPISAKQHRQFESLKKASRRVQVLEAFRQASDVLLEAWENLAEEYPLDPRVRKLLKHIQGTVAFEWGFPRVVMLARKRGADYDTARSVAMLLAHEALPSLSESLLGAGFGRTHEAVAWGIATAKARIETEPQLALRVVRLRKSLEEAITKDCGGNQGASVGSEASEAVSVSA